MFTYPENLSDSKIELNRVISTLKEQGYIVNTHREQVDTYFIDKITISKQARFINRIVLSSGLHGIEGYIGHVCQMHFLENILNDIDSETQVVLYHIINPFGMDTFRRFNHNNVDLNRNYSSNKFTSKNPEFLKVHDFLSPRKMKSIFFSNVGFYFGVFKNILRHSIQSMNIAILKGQKVDSKSIYYSGTEYEPSTKYILSELDSIYNYVNKVVWIDIHSGYGDKYQMSVINSRYETDITKDLKENLSYKDIIGFEFDTMYDTDGDITEKIYQVHKEHNHNSSLLALCFEFGTMGNKLNNTLTTFKTILFDNNVSHLQSSKRFKAYSKKLMKKVFLPNSVKWKTNAISKFDQATKEILQYKKLIK